MKIEGLINELLNTYDDVSSYAKEFADFMDSEYSDNSYYRIIDKYDKKFYSLIDNLKNYLKKEN